MIWDERLISPARAFDLAGDWSLTLDATSTAGTVYLRCSTCDQSTGAYSTAEPLSVEAVLSGVLRHLVMGHDVPLSGIGRPGGRVGDRTAGSADAGMAGAAGRGGVAVAHGRGQQHQAGARRGGAAVARGDEVEP